MLWHVGADTEFFIDESRRFYNVVYIEEIKHIPTSITWLCTTFKQELKTTT